MCHGAAQDLVERDARDMQRAEAPLKPAADAHLLDTTALGEAEVLAWAEQLVQQHCPGIAIAAGATAA